MAPFHWALISPDSKTETTRSASAARTVSGRTSNRVILMMTVSTCKTNRVQPPEGAPQSCTFRYGSVRANSGRRLSNGPRGFLLSIVFLSTAMSAQTKVPFKVIHTFGASGDGIGPSSGLISDNRGNLYGTTLGGGTNNTGIVYQLTPQRDGSWAENVLYSFGAVGSGGGDNPDGGLLMDASGNLYGVTELGGTNDRGTAFELTPGSGGWVETTLYNFCSLPNCADGGAPSYAPVLGAAGDLFGTTFGHQAVLYELSPSVSGWTETALYTFCSQPQCTDGDFPNGVIRDAAGNLYGSAKKGGSQGDGVIFTLREKPGGGWAYIILHNFNTIDPAQFPDAIVLHDGALYGNTTGCGASSCGTIFKLSRSGRHAQETDLYVFSNPIDGATPQGALAFDRFGRMFGATGDGGSGCGVGCGLIFEMTPSPGGKWQYQVVHSFNGDDGELPQYGVITDSAGHVFGTTLGGGAPYYGGVVFEISPPQLTAK